MLNSVSYPQCLTYGHCKICVGLTTQVRCVEGSCSEFPRQVSPEEDDHDEEPMSYEDMQTGPGVFCVEERTLRYLRTVTDIIVIFK